MKKVWRLTAVGFLSLASLPLAGWVGGNALATWQEQRSQQDWQAFVTPLSQPKPNSAALQLEVLTAELGIDLLGLGIPDRPQPDERDRQDFDAIKEDLQGFLDRQFERNSDRWEPLPVHLRRYLQAHHTEISTIRSQLLANPLPQWEVTTSAPSVTQPVPSFAGLVHLQRLLILTALEQQQAGDTPSAIATWEASWKLQQALRDRPEFGSQLTAVIVAKIQAGGLRKMRDLPAQWQQRLLEHDYRQSFITALYRDTWLAADLIRRSPSLRQTTASEGWQSSLQYLYLRFAALDAAAMMRHAYAQLTREDTCSFDPQNFDRNLNASLAVWNYEGGDITSGYAHQWRTAGYVMVDLELTQRVLQARHAIASSTPIPNRSLPSRICGSARWRYRQPTDQSLAIAFTYPLERPPQEGIGLVLPLSYQLQWKNSGSFQAGRITPQ